MEGHGVGEVPGIKVELGAADVSTAGSDAERTSPGDLGGPGKDAVFLLSSLSVVEMEALHFSEGLLYPECIEIIIFNRFRKREKERVKCKEDEPTLNVNVEILLEN